MLKIVHLCIFPSPDVEVMCEIVGVSLTLIFFRVISLTRF
jgi:hypothetical protein